MLILLISSIYLLIWGFVSIHGRVSKLGIGEKPLLYTSIFFQGILNLFFIIFLIFTVIFFIYSWKLALLLFFIGIFTGRFVFDPLVERFFFLPIAAFLIKKGKEIEEKERRLIK